MSKIFSYISPTRIMVTASEQDIKFLAPALTYTDPAVEGEYDRLKKNQWFKQKHGFEAWQHKLDELKKQLKICLLEPKGNSHYETMAGFAPRLLSLGYECIGGLPLEDEDERIGWPTQRKADKPRYYQSDAVAKLIEARHGAISLPTGAGKSWILEELTRYHGKRTLIMAPSTSIAGQLYKQFLKAFGAKRVGLYGDGKKQSEKQIVIGIAASLTRAAGKHLENLSKCEVFMADESHLCPANTFEKVCSLVSQAARFRYFVSATQIRNDGTEVLLEGITGEVVYKKSLVSLVEEGFLARPRFFTVDVKSPDTYWSQDWHEIADIHLWRNRELHRKAAQLANRFVDSGRKPVLILVDHTSQFQYLIGHLRHEVGFAHGPLTADSKDAVPAEFQNSDVDALVDKFNAGELPILVGTSCITTGTDLRPTAAILYLMSGESEIKVRQCIGRGTRKVEGKSDFIFVDFDVEVDGVEPRKNALARHFRQRCAYYDIGTITKLPL